MPFKENKGIAHIALILFAVVGILTFLLFTSAFSFKNNLFSSLFPKSKSYAATVADWPMAGANPQRTSWSSSEVPGLLKVEWVKPLEAYISQKTQVIAANNTIFVSTAKGLYAFDPSTGADKWVYPTELPLGNSPTFDNGVLYVGGIDRKLHAVDANTGQGLWNFTADGMFTTNPLVLNGVIYAGNHDGNIYAINAQGSANAGQLKWKYQTGGQIQQSAAASADSLTIYFASMDSFGYALDASTGSIKWKSAKMPGMGFRTWWPVVYQDKVIFFAAANTVAKQPSYTYDWVFPTSNTASSSAYPQGTLPGIKGTEPGNWPAGQETMDIRANPAGKTIPDFYEANPSQRMGIILNQSDGQEVKYDIDSDGIPDAAPVDAVGAKGSNNRYPPTVGKDGVLYYQMTDYYTGAIPGALPVGWKTGTPFLSLPVARARFGASPWMPHDEPTGFSMGGNYLYWNLCCDRYIGSADLSKPDIDHTLGDNNRQWRFTDANPPPMFPDTTYFPSGYNKTFWPYIWRINPTGIGNYYIEHGVNAGPVPYNGKLYVIRGNALIAFSSIGQGSTAPILPTAVTKSAPSATVNLDTNALKAKLEDQIQKIIAAGHLRSGFSNIGLDVVFNNRQIFSGEDDITHLWHSPGENFTVLLRALPYLNPTLQAQLKTYLQSEFTQLNTSCILCLYTHLGFQVGKAREAFDIPTPTYIGTSNSAAKGGRNFDNYYALWKYAQVFGNATTLYNSIKPLSFPQTPIDTATPNQHNNYIMGATGLLELQKLAGVPQDATKAANLQHFKDLRVANMKWDLSVNSGTQFFDNYFYVNLQAWNFMHLSDELADYLNRNALTQTQSTVSKYEDMTPYWMVAENEEVQMENGVSPYEQTHSLFQAKARILKQSQQEMVKYLDSPITPVGDMFYIDNLVSAIEAPNTAPPPGTKTGDINGDNNVNIVDLSILLSKWNGSDASSDLNKDGKVSIIDLSILLSNWGK